MIADDRLSSSRRSSPGPVAAPAALPLLAFAAGIALYGVLANPIAAVAGLAGIAILFTALRAPRGLRTKIVVALIACSLGIAAARREARSLEVSRNTLRRFPRNRFVRIDADADSTWEWTGGGVRMTVHGFEVSCGTLSASLGVPLTIYAPAPPHGDGNRIRAKGFLREPASGHWYLSVKSVRLLESSDDPRPWSPRAWNRAMNLALSRLARDVPDLERPVAVARALALGRKEGLTEKIRDDYRAGGTYHVLVFSGLQIALAAAFLNLLLRRLRRPRLADVALLAIAVLAPLFAGFEPSVTRSAAMIGLYALSRMFHRPTSMPNLLFVSAIVRLLVVPSELTDAGFLLTYAATGGLLFVGRAVAARTTRLLPRAAAVGVGAELLTLPLTALFFHRYVVGGSVVTAILSPVITAMLALSVITSILAPTSPAAAIPLLRCLGLLDRCAASVNAIVPAIPGATGFVIGPHPATVAVALILAVLLAGSRWRRRGFLAILALTIPLFAIPIREVAAHLSRPLEPTVEALDVGQGDSILLFDRDDAVLVDAGGEPGDPAFGRRRVLPLLLARGVRHLDAVVMSHPDEDHCGGFRTLLGSIPADELWLSARHVGSSCGRDVLEVARENEVRPRLMHDGDHDRIGRFRFDAIIARLRYKRATMNNSCVLYRVDTGHGRILLTGDIEKEAEATLAAEESDRIAAEVLKVAHHGARNSSSDRFLEAVHPRIAMISCGRANRFGHPHRETLDRLRKHHILWWRTDLSGSISIIFRSGSLRARHSDSAELSN